MPARKCREPDCGLEVLPKAYFCEAHINSKRRCKATKPNSGGKVRCKQPALPGLEVCGTHGGKTPTARQTVERARGYTAMQRFVRPFEGELNLMDAYEREFRRTIGRIVWLEEAISALTTEDLTWTKTEHVTAQGPDGIPSTKYEAKPHVYEEMLWRERKHQMELIKVGLAAKIEQRRLDILEVQAKWTIDKVSEAARLLGHDVHSPEVRDMLARLFDVTPPAIEAPAP